MVYQRTRNSRYAQYSRACDSRGVRAQFSMPLRRTANFNPMLDMLNQGVQMGGDMLGHAGQAAGDLANRFTDIPYSNLGSEIGARLGDVGSQIGNAASGAMHQGQQFLQNAGDSVGGAIRGVGDYFSQNPQAATIAKGAGAAGGLAAGAAGAAKAIDRFGRPIAQGAEEVAEAVSRPGFRERAGAMLKNPKALGLGALGAGGLGAAGYGASQMMNPDEQ